MEIIGGFEFEHKLLRVQMAWNRCFKIFKSLTENGFASGKRQHLGNGGRKHMFCKVVITMARDKVKHEFITDDLKRKVSFRKRKGSIMKKVNELSILCGVEAGVIIYSGPSDPRPEVFPNHQKVQQVIARYKAKPVLDKTLTQEGLIQQRINKEREHLRKLRKLNHDEEILQTMYLYMGGYINLNNMPAEHVFDLKMAIEQHLKEIDRLLEAAEKQSEVYVPAPPSSDESLITGENEKLADEILQHGLVSGNWNNLSYWNNMESLEDYMLRPLSNANYHNSSSSNNPFHP